MEHGRARACQHTRRGAVRGGGFPHLCNICTRLEKPSQCSDTVSSLYVKEWMQTNLQMGIFCLCGMGRVCCTCACFHNAALKQSLTFSSPLSSRDNILHGPLARSCFWAQKLAGPRMRADSFAKGANKKRSFLPQSA